MHSAHLHRRRKRSVSGSLSQLFGHAINATSDTVMNNIPIFTRLVPNLPARGYRFLHSYIKLQSTDTVRAHRCMSTRLENDNRTTLHTYTTLCASKYLPTQINSTDVLANRTRSTHIGIHGTVWGMDDPSAVALWTMMRICGV